MELFKEQISADFAERDNEMPNMLTCDDCGKQSLSALVHLNGSVCPFCGGLFRMPARARIAVIADEGTFVEMDESRVSTDPLEFPKYKEKLAKAKKETGLNEAIITGTAKIAGNPCGLAVMDSYFMMGSMGSVVGEKICALAEVCLKKKLPLVIFSASGGARMQEGMISLLQMTRTTMAINRLGEAGLLYISVLTHPTTGGVTASFAMQGDVIISEPKALIGFAGPRVITQTVNEELPEEFQKAEYLYKQGMIDAIVKREDIKAALARLLALHAGKQGENHDS